METIRYRGRDYTRDDIERIRSFVEDRGDLSRYRIAKDLCKEWGWTQPNGALKDNVCRGLLLTLHRQGLIELPAPGHNPNALSTRKPPPPVPVDESPVTGGVKDLFPLALVPARRTRYESLYKGLIAHHHYLGYTRPVGEHLEYLVMKEERPLACIGWMSAPRHIGERDRYLGWSREERLANLHKIAINTRFLILPWVRVPHFASYVLGRMAKRISRDWDAVYRHEIVWLETFVDPERGFAGTCYKAANWHYLGLTTGRGKMDTAHAPNRSLKYIFGYPLKKDFRKALYGVL